MIWCDRFFYINQKIQNSPVCPKQICLEKFDNDDFSLLFIHSADVSQLQPLLWWLKDYWEEELKRLTRLSLKLHCKI